MNFLVLHFPAQKIWITVECVEGIGQRLLSASLSGIKNFFESLTERVVYKLHEARFGGNFEG